MAHAEQNLLRAGPLERGQQVGRLDLVREVGMAIDQPRHDGRARQIDHPRAGRRLGRPRLDRLDLVSADQHQPVPQHLTAVHVDQAARMQGHELLGPGRTSTEQGSARHAGEHERESHGGVRMGCRWAEYAKARVAATGP